MQNTVLVGKYTLESLTTGMYADPKIIYREYIQNSVDSLETAVRQDVIEKQSMRIDIILNAEESSIMIRDNGVGIPSKTAVSTLLNIGHSEKRHTSNRGFRGIGRLGGMSYCDRLVFTTSAENEPLKTKVSFDCKKLRELLIPGANEDLNLNDVLTLVTTSEISDEVSDRHYFVVEMFGVSSFSDLLNLDVVESYISQVAPVPYKTKRFYYCNELRSYLNKNGYQIEEFPIFIGEDDSHLEPVYKQNRVHYYCDKNKTKSDEILNIRYFDVRIGDELFALGWYGECSWTGTISMSEISGMRIRNGNILIGDGRTLNPIFREGRFNGWTQGELFIVTDKLIPNARRDDFEQTETYNSFIKVLQDGIGYEISKKIREASVARNDTSQKMLIEVQQHVVEAGAAIEEGFNSSTDKEKILSDLSQAQETLRRTKVKPELQEQKQQLQERLAERIEEVSDSKNYKLNQINSGIDKKSKKLLAIVSDVLSQKLAKNLVDDIIDAIIMKINGG